MLRCCSDDDPETTPASRIDWTALQADTYYLEVMNHDSSVGGCNFWTYEISVMEDDTPPIRIYLPLVQKNR